jgi:Transmembrane exosortase (Exosortase_EpsH)
MTPRSRSSSPAQRGSPWAIRELVLWGALGAAFSASWVDLVQHWMDEPWARPAVLFLALFLVTAARDRRPQAPRRGGAVLVAAGLGLSLIAFGGSLSRLGRPGIPLGIIGMAQALGRPSLPTSLLALWIIPPPFTLSEALSPGLERGLARLAASAAEAWGLAAVLGPRSLEIAGATLEIRRMDGGVPLAIYLAGVGWWGAVQAGGGVREALYAAARTAPWGFVAQALALCLAFALLAFGAPNAARTVLDHDTWPILALALYWVRPVRIDLTTTGAAARPRHAVGEVP